MAKARSKEKSISSLAFEETREAVVKIKTLKPLLSSKDAETLTILMDKGLMTPLDKSLKEAAEGKIEPLENILA
ncbi:MAG: hypothetical protein WD187_03785 [Candidatus Woykebacteria bacterium]